MSERGTEVRFRVGDVLVHHGEVSSHCYAIRSGEVLVTAVTSQGATVVLARRGTGSVIGELAALGGEPRSATVRATTDVVAVALSATELESFLRDRPDLAVAELCRLSRQLRELTERLSLRGEDLRARLSTLLSTNADETGDPVFRSTREELAGWVGATREAVTRTLHHMEGAGVVALRRGAVEWFGTR